MKHFCMYISFCMSLIALLASCSMDDKADDATPRLHVSEKEIAVVKTGKLKDGSAATFQIAANKGYKITSDAEWLTVDKPEGSGLVDIVVACTENNTGAERTGKLYVTATGLADTVTVTQNTFDPNAVVKHRTFYSEDFSWTEAIATANELKDPVGDPASGYTRMQITDSRVADAWAASGLTDWYKATKDPKAANKINIQNGYLNFNSNASFNTGIILPALTGFTGSETTDAFLSFSASPDAGKNGADAVTLVIEITAGTGSFAKDSDEPTTTVTLPDARAWAQQSFQIYGISATTRIAIHTNAPSTQKYCRWYIDNISVKE